MMVNFVNKCQFQMSVWRWFTVLEQNLSFSSRNQILFRSSVMKLKDPATELLNFCGNYSNFVTYLTKGWNWIISNLPPIFFQIKALPDHHLTSCQNDMIRTLTKQVFFVYLLLFFIKKLSPGYFKFSKLLAANI